MTDIVERLRATQWDTAAEAYPLFRETANEIERLRRENARLTEHLSLHKELYATAQNRLIKVRNALND